MASADPSQCDGVSDGGAKPRLLVCSWEWPPDSSPMANGASAAIRRLTAKWDVAVVGRTGVSTLPGTRGYFVDGTRSLREAETRPAWTENASKLCTRIAADWRPAVFLSFLMPYSNGDIALRVKKATGVPTVAHLNDSPTCCDMHPVFASRREYDTTLRRELRWASELDAVVYVSETNAERIRSQLPSDRRSSVRVVRIGSEVSDPSPDFKSSGDSLRVIFIGGMTGWIDYRRRGLRAIKHTARQLRDAVLSPTKRRLTRLSHLGSSPYYVGRALAQVKERRPGGRLSFDVLGESRPRHMIDRPLAAWGLESIVTVSGPIPQKDALREAQQSDVLFLCLPDRPDGTVGGRISAKTYDYLCIDRPILAALPRGENRSFLEGRPSVRIVDPNDERGMAEALSAWLDEKGREGRLFVDRSDSRAECSNDARAEKLHSQLQSVVRSSSRT